MLAAPATLPSFHVDTHDTWSAFTDRLLSSHFRLALCFIVLVIVALLVSRTYNWIFGIAAGVGAGWMMWYIFNFFGARKEPLFIGSDGPTSEWHLWFNNGTSLLFGAVAILGGAVVFAKTKQKDGKAHLTARIFAWLGTWAAVMLFYTLVVEEFQIPHLIHVWYQQLTA